ncbi:hypothetical protein GCM10010376_63790 [Streptomyces violaceusniger]
MLFGVQALFQHRLRAPAELARDAAARLRQAPELLHHASHALDPSLTSPRLLRRAAHHARAGAAFCRDAATLVEPDDTDSRTSLHTAGDIAADAFEQFASILDTLADNAHGDPAIDEARYTAVLTTKEGSQLNASDQTVIRQVEDDMRDWTLSKIVWVTDRGFSSEEDRRYLRSGNHAYIIGEKLRSGSPEVKVALSRQGRYTEIAENMRVKEVRISETERFVICHTPEAAERDRLMREQLVAQLTELIADTDTLSDFKRGEVRGKISSKPGLNRYLRATPAGKLRIDQAKIKAEENLDGKYLLRCSDPHLSAEDIALGYKQLLEVERGWRDMKQITDLRPVYHRLEERIRAHVVLCWLALLLIRIVETQADTTWAQARRELQHLHAGTFTGPTGTFEQVTGLTKPQSDLLAKLGIPHPKQVLDLQASPR